MKFFRYLFFSGLLAVTLSSCGKESANIWETKVAVSDTPVEITDLSKEFYDAGVPLQTFKEKYPWFQGSVPDEDFGLRRSDPEEIKIYNDAISKINIEKLSADLKKLFARVQHYFPEFREPRVFLYSSVLASALDPVFYQAEENMLFIDITGFMGENHPNYKGMESYFQKSMNPQNIVAKSSLILGEHFLSRAVDGQKFIDQIILEGKLMILQDAFLPDEPDYLKIGYTPAQYEWAQANEANIWNYFVENNLVFSDDMRLAERFIRPGPFSKFYTEIDNDSSPQIGIFTGWQICRKFHNENPDTKLQDFLKMNAQDLFNQSNYKPKNQ